MLRTTDHCKEYKNHNLLIRFDDDMQEFAKKDEIYAIASVLEEVDCVFIGESYSLSNYAIGHTIYNAYSDMVYIFNWAELETLKKGKSVRLYARKPDETDREIINNEYEL